MRKKLLQVLLGAVLVWPLLASPVLHQQSIPSAKAFTARNLMYGSRGYDVDELQNRLGFIGYYHGKVDGVFGWKTYWAVRNFQYQFGMKVTGLVDLKTKHKLVAASKGWHYSGSSRGGSASTGGASDLAASVPADSRLSMSDVRLMQHVVYGEARGEPFEGEVAIAAVILNRLRDPRFPHTVPGIVYQPGAFTAVADGQVNLQPDAKAMRAVTDALHGWDPSHGAVYYFNPATATSPWIWSRPQIVQIGKHIFCR
ncbi:spore cortex-lytic enzyme [Alicyclobacillus contaminans]|uniref:spore cortex-lytic enzyme n=1 Tax=Alicyclobacillus contaminans TaxID=392016 RepID=UPI00042981E9|nr:spore cortex-lytic enzyme [Alicyclobacillus contaminans]GMA52508.1 spore cortex-lytic enzyme [Alicyclobacillus contaminans]